MQQGNNQQTDAALWMYLTAAQANGSRLHTTALDAPGHKAQTTWQN
jgi:hypothetical protein